MAPYMRRMGTKSRTRLHLELSPELRKELDEAAAEAGCSLSDVFRISFALFRVYRRERLAGNHVGAVADPTKLDREIIGIM